MKASVVFTVVALFSASVWAESGEGFYRLTMNGQRRAQLGHCGGTAVLSKGWFRGLKLTLSGITSCSNVSVDDGTLKKLSDADDGTRQITLAMDEQKERVKVQVYSNSGKTQDVIEVLVSIKDPTPIPIPDNIPTAYLDTKWKKSAALPDCEGRVALKRIGQKYYLVFSRVKYCSKLSFVGPDGNGLGFDTPDISLNDQPDADIEVPDDIVGFGKGSILAIFKSNSGKHRDVISISFR